MCVCVCVRVLFCVVLVCYLVCIVCVVVSLFSQSLFFQTALGNFEEQHSLYLAAKALFDKKSANADRTKAGELKVLTAMIEMHLALVRLLKMLVELRAAFDTGMTATTSGSVTERPVALMGLQVIEERNRGALNELMSL